MKHKVMSIAALAGMLTVLGACDVVTHPVAVVGPSQTVFRGTATATLFEGGWFQVHGGETTCRGQYSPGTLGAQITFPVTCTNGLTGIGTATYSSAVEGGGTIVMQDGTQWQFIFGRRALRI